MKKRPSMLGTREKDSPSRKAFWAVVYCLLIFCALFLIADIWIKQSYFVVNVDGVSMQGSPEDRTIHDGDVLYAARYNGEVRRGDVVVIDVSNSPYFQRRPDPPTNIIKRVIATEGDTLRIDGDGAVYLRRAGTEEEELLEEPYIKGNSAPKSLHGKWEWTLKEGEIFVMGDNREDSDDSRYAGAFPAEDIIGVVLDWSYLGGASGWESVTAFFIRTFLGG